MSAVAPEAAHRRGCPDRMDERVRAAMARWPDVPAVSGWLELTARGQWRIRGEPIGNAALRDFIGRNDAADAPHRFGYVRDPKP